MKSLLTIAPPTEAFPRENLTARGGFLWWYADALDQDGNGVVLIWSFGLPFLPGYASAARRGAAPPARERPSLNVAVYREGRPVFYSLQEYAASEADWTDGSWRFGSSELATRTERGRRTMEARLNLRVPGQTGLRLEGTVVLSGPARRARATDDYSGNHDWAPLVGPSTASVRLRVGDQRYEFDARGYFDCNTGTVPLHETGIRRWTWGRAPLEDRDAIYYILWGDDGELEAHGIEIDEAGELQAFAVELDMIEWRRALAGMRYPSRMRLLRDGSEWLELSARSVLDDGPFYVRYFQDVRAAGQSVHGKAEICRTDRIDLGLHRPLVRMRVEQVGGDNSMWLPLFTGPRQGRVRRLFTQFVGG